MIRDLPDDVVQLARRAQRDPLVGRASRSAGPNVDRGTIERMIPHRRPFLLIEQVTAVDRENALIVGCFDGRAAESVIGVHFPGDPLVPGVLQVEAIGQLGLCLIRLADSESGVRASGGSVVAEPAFRLTQIIDARFLRPVRPGSTIEIAAAVVEDGLFNIVVGQCIQRDEVCSVAVVRGTSWEAET